MSKLSEDIDDQVSKNFVNKAQNPPELDEEQK